MTSIRITLSLPTHSLGLCTASMAFFLNLHYNLCMSLPGTWNMTCKKPPWCAAWIFLWSPLHPTSVHSVRSQPTDFMLQEGLPRPFASEASLRWPLLCPFPTVTLPLTSHPFFFRLMVSSLAVYSNGPLYYSFIDFITTCIMYSNPDFFCIFFLSHYAISA